MRRVEQKYIATCLKEEHSLTQKKVLFPWTVSHVKNPKITMGMEMMKKMKIKLLKCVNKSTKVQENVNKALKQLDTYQKLTTTHVITSPALKSFVRMVLSLKLDPRQTRPLLSSLVSSLLPLYFWPLTCTTWRLSLTEHPSVFLIRLNRDEQILIDS